MTAGDWSVRIREFVASDAAQLRGVFVSSVHTLASGFYTVEQLEAWAPATYDESDWACKLATMRPFVAVADDQPVGYADLQDSGYIDHFFVSARFSARGVGSALMQRIHDAAVARSIWRLSADVSRSAEAFFLRHGFRLDYRQTTVRRGVSFENARMYRVLANRGGGL